jgi:hypothetical protein
MSVHLFLSLSLSLSFSLQGTAWIPLDGFSLILIKHGIFQKSLEKIPCLIKI